MHWVLQQDIFEEPGFPRLIDALLRARLTFSVHKIEPFTTRRIVPRLSGANSAKMICIGSYAMRHEAESMCWEPGVFTLDHATFEEQKKHWGDRMLNADARPSTFGGFSMPNTAERFIRPVKDDKFFPGKMFTGAEWRQFVNTTLESVEEIDHGPCYNTMIMDSAFKVIYAEWRLWVVDGKIVTLSRYKFGGRSYLAGDASITVTGFGEEVIDAYAPARAFCLDVCNTPDGMKIVEINCINASGFYAADMQKLVYALENMQ